MSEADNSLLTLEHASDDELRTTRDAHGEIRRAALGEQSGPASTGPLRPYGPDPGGVDGVAPGGYPASDIRASTSSRGSP